jgi:uncharacterized Zn-finger protein
MKGRVYRIYYKEDLFLCYVGSTLKTLKRRWDTHKKDYKKWVNDRKNRSEISIYPFMEDYGFENFEIELLKEYDVFDETHLEAYEQLWMNRLHTCVNKHCAFDLKLRQCPLCHKKFIYKGDIKIHIQSVHDKIKYPCDLCNKEFTQKNNLNTHIQSVHNGLRYLCDLCDKKFIKRDSLYSHIQSVHDKIKYPCDLCNKEFAYKKSLKRHINKSH